jgi:hypothetical protein
MVLIVEQIKQDALIRLVRKSKKFSGVDEKVILYALLKRLEHDQVMQRFLERSSLKGLERNKKTKRLVKDVRAVLFPMYGMYYNKHSDDRFKLLKELKKDSSLEMYKNILHCHASSRERLPFYEKLYREIFTITGKPTKILDLGCGLNPFSLPFMKLKNIEYLASDFSPSDCAFLEEYFTIAKIKGRVICLNLTDDVDATKVWGLPHVDVCFLLKVVDVIDQKGHKASEILLKNIKSDFVVVSFSTMTLSNKKMRKPKRTWFEVMVKRLGYTYTEIEKPNEIFYVVDKRYSS